MGDLSKNIWNLSFEQVKTLYLHYHNAYDHKFGRVVTCHKGLPHINSHDSLISWSLESTWQTKIIIFTGTKFGRVVKLLPTEWWNSYLQKLLPIESHGSWVTWSCEITRQNKDFISPLPQCLQSPKFGRVTSYHEELPVIKSQCLFYHVVFWDYMVHLNHYILIQWFWKMPWQTKIISPTKVPMATKLGRIVAYPDGLLPIQSPEALIMLSCKITWQTKTIISPLLQCLRSPNLAGNWRTVRGSDQKVPWPFSNVVLHVKN